MKLIGKLLKGVCIVIGAFVLLCALLVSCADTSDTQTDKQEIVAEEPVAEEPVAEEPVAEEPVAEEPVAEEQVVYDADGIKVTFKGYEEGWIGTNYKFVFENNTDKDIFIMIDNYVIDGYTFSSICGGDVKAGAKLVDEDILSDDELEECGISEVNSIDYTAHWYPSDHFLDGKDINFTVNLK